MPRWTFIRATSCYFSTLTLASRFTTVSMFGICAIEESLSTTWSTTSSHWKPRRRSGPSCVPNSDCGLKSSHPAMGPFASRTRLRRNLLTSPQFTARVGPVPFDVGYFHLGADLHRSAPSRGLPEDADKVLSLLHARPTFLMVGTVEPRKAHRQTVRAFELLWDAGVDVNLVIVGKMGWGMESFDDELLHHPRAGEKLLWLQGISDEFLERIYASSKALIAASEGEGFGLPLIEAAQHGLKLIIRDIPVFREVAGENAHYFADDRDPRVITRSIEEWLRLDASGRAPKSSAIQFLSWEQSAGQLMDFIEGRSARLAVRADGNLCPGTSYGVSDGKLSWTGFSAPRAGVRWVGAGTSRVTFKWQEQTRFGLMQVNGPALGGSLVAVQAQW